MKISRTWAMAKKEFLHILRDRWSLGMAVAIPMLLLLIFGYALTLDVDRVPMAIWDQSETPASRDLISGFTGSRYFAVGAYVNKYRDVEAAIDRGDVLVALVIPADFARDVGSGRAATVQLLVDGSDANTATIATGYADIVARSYSDRLLVRRFQRTVGRSVEQPIDFRPRVWFNEELESKNYIVPGLIAVIMTIIAALLTSLTVAREWERGTMEQLISTPVRGSELIFGKLLPYFVIGMVDVLLAVLMGEFLFQVPLRGSVAMLFGTAAIFLCGALSLGMLVSIFAKNQLVASQMAILLTFIPSYLLSGFMFSISNMPTAVQVVTYLIPARYFISVLKGIYLKGVGLYVIGGEALLLTAFAVVTVALANLKFRKRL